MKSSFHLISLFSILITTNSQNINQTQSDSEEYIPGDHQSNDYHDYPDYNTESNQILDFVNFTKCCPEDQVSFCNIHF